VFPADNEGFMTGPEKLLQICHAFTWVHASLLPHHLRCSSITTSEFHNSVNILCKM